MLMREKKMRTEVQKALNKLYHDGVDLELINLVISYIEKLESENADLLKKLARLVMEYDKAD